MATHRPRNFCSISVLQNLERGRLRQLLLLYPNDIFPARVPLPPENIEEEYDYGLLARTLIDPGIDTPVELIHALYHLDEMSEDRFFDDLREIAERAGLHDEIGEEPTAADLALLVWLHDRDRLLRKHAEVSMLKSRTFEYFRTPQRPVPGFQMPTEARINSMRATLSDFFVRRKRGPDCDVIIIERGDLVWIAIAHGLPARREPARINGVRGSAFFRPDHCDVMIYDKVQGEIGIHAACKKEKEIYRSEIARCLFGDSEVFQPIAKYTLQPLQNDGAQSLCCDDVADGSMEWIKLKEVHISIGGDFGEVMIRKADDLFEAIEAATPGGSLPNDLLIFKAKFAIKFTHSRNPRIVTVYAPAKTDCRHESDRPLVEDWLRRRGFVLDLATVAQPGTSVARAA